MKIVATAEMREIDRRTSEECGVPSLTLMENAGAAVADFVLSQYPEAKRVGVICGKGSNGGDGFVCARKLHEAGKQVRVLLLADPSELTGDAAAMCKRLPLQVVVARNQGELDTDAAQQIFKSSDILVDAILGTGFKPPVTAFYRGALQEFWSPDVTARVVSVDIPSGVDADAPGDAAHPTRAEDFTAYARSDAIVTFTAAKRAHIFQSLTHGPIVVARIGSPTSVVQSHERLNVITRFETDFATLPRGHKSHKGDFGHVLVIAGSRGKSGAAAMAGIGALRSGAGLCTVATPASSQALVSSFAPELMTEDLAETEAGTLSLRALQYGRVDDLVRNKSVIAIGPGFGQDPEAQEFVRTVVHRRHLPLVLDADGLNAFAGMDERLDGSQTPLILTPHPGEMARLARLTTQQVQQDRVGVARKFACDHNCIVVLKGWRTVVADASGEVWINATGNPGMATGGTGDILTGMIAGFAAQAGAWRDISLLQRVLAAVRMHGLAGDLAAEELGEQAMIATDLLRYLPTAFRRSEWHLKATPIVEGRGKLRYREQHA